MKTITKFESIIELVQTLNTEEKCREYLKKLRWREGIICPHCQNSEKKIYEYKSKDIYRCSACSKDFSVTTKSIFHKTRIPLMNWFFVLYSFLSDKKGISSVEVSRKLGISQKTAWIMLHKIRCEMRDREGKLYGAVEIDETFFGGKNKNRHYNKRVKNNQGRALVDKACIYGFIERDGRVRTIHIRKLLKNGMQLLLKKFVDTSSTIYSDEYKAYKGLDKMFESHKVVNHGAYQYVDGDKTTNTIEAFWSFLKRGLTGTYHNVSHKLIHRYCSEFEYRWNMRKKSVAECFENLIDRCFRRKITWDIVTSPLMKY